jgi:hypothetical protein
MRTHRNTHSPFFSSFAYVHLYKRVSVNNYLRISAGWSRVNILSAHVRESKASLGPNEVLLQPPPPRTTTLPTLPPTAARTSAKESSRASSNILRMESTCSIGRPSSREIGRKRDTRRWGQWLITLYMQNEYICTQAHNIHAE